MEFQEIEERVSRAWSVSFSRRKLVLAFLVLAACSLIAIFFRTLSDGAGKWAVLPLTLFPFFLSAGLLLSAGIVCIRSYHHGRDGASVSYGKIFSHSWPLLLGSTYLTLPLLIVYIFAWMLMGLFSFFSSIPSIGEVVRVVFAFGPFLVVLLSLALTLSTLVLLFFATPHLAMEDKVELLFLQKIYQRMGKQILAHVLLFLIGILPLAISFVLLFFSAHFTPYFGQQEGMASALSRFFIAIPCCAILSPSLLFFFHFSMESFLFTSVEVDS